MYLKKYLLIVTTILLLNNSCLASNNDSIEKVIKSTLNDSIKIKLLNDLVWEYMFNNKALANKYITQSLHIAERSKNLNSLSDTYNTLGAYYTVNSDFEKSVLYHSKAIKVRTQLNDTKGLMKSYNNIGSAYKNIGQYEKEIKYFFLALNLAEKLKDSTTLTVVLNNISTAFDRQENYSKSLEYNFKALKIRQRTNDYKGVLSSYINIANTYYKLKEFKTSQLFFDRADSIINKVNDNYVVAYFHANYAALLKDLLKFEDAIYHINSSIQLNNAIGNQNNNLINYINLAAIYESQQKTNLANEAYHQSLLLSQKIGNIQWQRQSYLGLATTFYSKNNYKEAYNNLEKYQILKDSLMNLNLKSSILELDTKYQNEKLVTNNKLLVQKNKTDELASKQKSYAILFLIMICFTLIFVGFIYRKNLILKQQLKSEKLVKSTEIEERQRIAKDIHDELGSGLTKIRFMSELAQKEKNVSVGSLNSIAETSNSLVENMRDLIWLMNPDNASLENLVARIREHSSQFLEDFGIEVKYDFPNTLPLIEISKEFNRNIFMVVKEALNNIVKHSKATLVKITMVVDTNFNIEICDNGTGTVLTKTDGNGLKNMAYRIKQLNGNFKIDSKSGNGTSLYISTPL